jgi:uncharacterized Zn finger protein (UPF0148 family)
MFYIWGIGRARKNTKVLVQETCNNCGTSQNMNIITEYGYGSLFFIPILKFNKKYYVVCPGCGAYKKISKREFKAIKKQNQNALVYEQSEVVVSKEEPMAIDETSTLKADIVKEIESLIAQLKEKNYVLTDEKLPHFKQVLKEQLLKTFNNEQVVDETIEEYFKK